MDAGSLDARLDAVVGDFARRARSFHEPRTPGRVRALVRQDRLKHAPAQLGAEAAGRDRSDLGWHAVARYAAEPGSEDAVVEACRVNLAGWGRYLDGIAAAGDRGTAGDRETAGAGRPS